MKRVISALSSSVGRKVRSVRRFAGMHKKTAIATTGILAAAVIAGTFPVAHNISNALSRGQGTGQSGAVHGFKDGGDSSIGKLNTAKTSGNAQSTNTKASDSTPSPTGTTTGKPVIKYSTSPDPRSTAYSTTPPGPSPTDFTKTVTHNGQFAPGTLIASNAVKHLKVYYGGDLVVASQNLSVSEHLGSNSPQFTISMPDGKTSVAPSAPWNDQSSIAFAAQYTDVYKSEGTSWTMFLQLYGKPTPSVQPYYIHLQTTRTVGDADWEYDAFVPLYVDN